MGKHPLIIIFESIIALLYRTGGSPDDGILDASVDRPRQFQSGRFGPTLFVFSTGCSDKPDTTVFVQLGSVLEPPWRIEIGKDRGRANEPNAWELTPGLDDGIFAGIGTELFLRQLHLLFGGIIANP